MINPYSGLLSSVLRQCNPIVINVVFSSVFYEWFRHHSTEKQFSEFKSDVRLGNMLPHAIEFFNVAVAIRQLDYDPDIFMPECYEDVPLPEGLKQLFYRIDHLETNWDEYSEFLSHSIYKNTSLENVFLNFVNYRISILNLMNSIISSERCIDAEFLREDWQELAGLNDEREEIEFHVNMFLYEAVEIDPKNFLLENTPLVWIAHLKRCQFYFKSNMELPANYLENKNDEIQLIMQNKPSGKRDQKRVFISYSHDSDEYKDWVRNFALELVKYGIIVILDQWDLRLGEDLGYFMEKIRESNYVLIICTPGYKNKADSDEMSGVRAEKHIISSEIYHSNGQCNKFIPILRAGSLQESIPVFLEGINYVDFTQGMGKLSELIGTILEIPTCMDLYEEDGILKEYLNL